MNQHKEQMNIVIAGHVDHGKSTVIGRMLADTNSLPEGKLEQVKNYCVSNSREFEYAFLLDALKDEQAQGITIDSARCFFKSEKRDYIIIDAPGHIEFLKNMISGAARAEAALLVIDAKEGIQENTRRHSYMLKMLGISQIAIIVNKMDLVGYNQEIFEKIRKEFTQFLIKIGVEPKAYIPVSGKMGDNISRKGNNLSWFEGKTVLEQLDSFEKEAALENKPLRMPVQGIYKFTGEGDERRIIAGKIESGRIAQGDEVLFLPSNKRSKIKKIDEFNKENLAEREAGHSTSIILEEQIYIKRGDIMCKPSEMIPKDGSLIKVNVFWMGKKKFSKEKEYKLKIGTASIPVRIKEILTVLDASNLQNEKKEEVEKHEVAECILETSSSFAFDTFEDIQATSRFVIVDEYEISGGGIIVEALQDSQFKTRQKVILRERKWDRGLVSSYQRSLRLSQKPALILITGKKEIDKKTLAKELEKELFQQGRHTYFLGIGNLLRGVDADIEKSNEEEHIRRLAEVSNILIDAGLIVIATASDLNEEDLNTIKTSISEENRITLLLGDPHITGIDMQLDKEDKSDISITKIINLLKFKNIIFDPLK